MPTVHDKSTFTVNSEMYSKSKLDDTPAILSITKTNATIKLKYQSSE